MSKNSDSNGSDSDKSKSKDTNESTYDTRTITTRSIMSTRKLAAKFMENFNPETSAREQRKLNHNYNISRKKYQNVLYDDHGIYMKSRKDICDCLNEHCPGCFFPCPKCRSTKCGAECRVRRKFMYDYIEFDGSELKVKNPYNESK